MAITNPTKYASVRRLERFKQKIDQLYATKSEVPEQIASNAASVDTCIGVVGELE